LFPGPISVSIYLNRTSSLNAYTKKLKELLAPRKNIAIHIVKESGVRTFDVIANNACVGGVLTYGFNEV